MLIKTHLAIVLFFVLLFVSYVEYKVVFVIAALIAAAIPDADAGSSTLGQKGIFRFFQIFTKHRGFIHSFTFGILISVILTFLFPVAALGFFLGYTIHIFSDSFTREGVTPFWPYPKRSKGLFITGGRIEMTVFIAFVVADIALMVFAFL